MGTSLPRGKGSGVALLILLALIFLGWQWGLAIFLLYLSPLLVQFIVALVKVFVALLRWRRTPEDTPLSLPATTDGNVVPFVKATKAERERVMAAQGHRCANPYCNMDLRQSTPHWDHITPRSKGGTDSVHNMQWLCDACNLNTKDMDWVEFVYRYATSLGIDPNKNQKPWQQWILNRAKNGFGTP
jgi:hypothetical protein